MADADANSGPAKEQAGNEDGGRGPKSAIGRSALPDLLIACVWDDNGRLVKTDRFVHELGRWRAVEPDESAPGLDEPEQVGGRWSIAWQDADSGDDSANEQMPNLSGDPPTQCPECKGAGTILLLTSRRSCDRCGGMGTCKD